MKQSVEEEADRMNSGNGIRRDHLSFTIARELEHTRWDWDP